MTHKILVAVALASTVSLTAAAETRIEKPVTFEWGKVRVADPGKRELRVIANAWKANPDRPTLVVEGHGLTNDEEDSIRLGEMRARNVRAYLVHYGVDPKSVIAVGHSRATPGRYVDIVVAAK